MYTAVTQVNGRLGAGEVSFDFEILPEKTAVNWLFIGIGGLVLITLVGFFFSQRPAND
jgi:hypothetical protein